MNKKLLLVLLIASVCFTAGLNWGLPDAAGPETVTTWAPDSVAPIMPLNEAYYRFTREGNEWVVYPLFHFIVLDLVYAPYVAIQYFSGELEKPSSAFPYGVKNPRSFVRDLTLIARAISLLMALGIVIVAYKLTAELFSKDAAFWAALFVALLPPLSYYAKTSNLDVPYIFWSSIAFLQYVRIVKYQKLKNYLGLSITAALAIASKDQAYGFFVLTPAILVYALARHRAKGGKITWRDIVRAAGSKPIFVSFVLMLAVFALANNLLFGGWSGFVRHISFHTGLLDERLVESPEIRATTGQLALLARSAILLLQAFGLGVFLLSLLGIVQAAWRRHWLALSTLIFILSYQASCISFVGVVFSRYMIGPAIILASFAGYVVADLLVRRESARVLGAIVVALSIGWEAALTANLNLSLIKDSRYVMASWIRNHVPPGSTIETQVKKQYLPRVTGSYDVSVVGKTTVGDMIADELSEKNLKRRNPEYILILKGCRISGDPDTWTDPRLVDYYEGLIQGEFGYEVLARFETPHFISYPQIPGTRPTSILLGRSLKESVRSERRLDP